MWNKLLDTVLWIDTNANAATYLRQIDVPGVDTKFVEANRTILAKLLDRQLDNHRVDPTKPPSDFEGRYRFRRKPTYVRIRSLDSRVALAGPWFELTVRADELGRQPPTAATVYVLENEVTYLALPPIENAIAILGSGYAVARVETLDWLADRTLVYWGDIDTHGFAILNHLRRRFPHTRSMLMDRATLFAHEQHWVQEGSQVTTALPHLQPTEADLYQDPRRKHARPSHPLGTGTGSLLRDRTRPPGRSLGVPGAGSTAGHRPYRSDPSRVGSC